MAFGSGAVPAFTMMGCVIDIDGCRVRCVITVAHADPPPSGVTGRPVTPSVKYGSSWQLLGKVSSTAPVVTLATVAANAAAFGLPTKVGSGVSDTRIGASQEGPVGLPLQPPAAAAAATIRDSDRDASRRIRAFYRDPETFPCQPGSS